MIDFRNRPAKDAARRYLFGTSKRPLRRSLWLPSAQCIDIKLAFTMGLLDRNSEIIAVEENAALYQRMRRTLATIADKQRLVHEPLAIHARLHEVTLYKPLDFAFIDLCGTCDPVVLLWIERMLAPHLRQAADVAITCTYATRRAKYFQACREVLLERWRELYFEFVFSHDYWIASKHPYEPIILPALLLKCAFHTHDMIIRRPFTYRDDYPMLGIKLADIRCPGRDVYPAFSNLHARVTHA